VLSNNNPLVLRLLMSYYTALKEPDFERANIYATELQQSSLDDGETIYEVGAFHILWSTAIKMNMEIDPFREMDRQQRYKALATIGTGLLERAQRATPEYYHLLAQGYYNRWDYDRALRNILRAIGLLPTHSDLRAPYERLKEEIDKAQRRHEAQAGRRRH
jgi:hypothetical protein